MRLRGIEPRAQEWKSYMLPLHQRRFFFSDKPDLNKRPIGLQPTALPTELLSVNTFYQSLYSPQISSCSTTLHHSSSTTLLPLLCSTTLSICFTTLLCSTTLLHCSAPLLCSTTSVHPLLCSATLSIRYSVHPLLCPSAALCNPSSTHLPINNSICEIFTSTKYLPISIRHALWLGVLTL